MTIIRIRGVIIIVVLPKYARAVWYCGGKQTAAVRTKKQNDRATTHPTHPPTNPLQQSSSAALRTVVNQYSTTTKQHSSATVRTVVNRYQKYGQLPQHETINMYELIHHPARHHSVHPPPTLYPQINPLQQYSIEAVRTAVYRCARSIWLVLES